MAHPRFLTETDISCGNEQSFPLLLKVVNFFTLLYFESLHPLRLHQASSLIDLLLKMVEAQRITEPRLLSNITTGLSNLSIEATKSSHSGSEAQQVKLVLLQPLANIDMLTACRNPDSRLIRKSDGSVCGTSNHEYLDIRPLSLAWRQAVTKVPPISHITFDLTLPRPVEDEKSTSGEFQKVYWDTAVPKEGGLAVGTQDVMTLAITLATGTRMRADGILKFRITYDETEGASLRGVKLLEKQLLALEPEYKVPVKGEEHCDRGTGDQDGGE
jgi:hypothetical protein